MSRQLFTRSILSATCSIALLCCGTAMAQFSVPFQITSGSGTLDRFPVFPDDVGAAGIPHHITVGTASIDGQALNYTGSASIRVLDVPDANFTVPFDSDLPFTFDFGGGDTLQMHYGRLDFGAPDTGFATVSPGSAMNLFNVEFLATFTYVPGSGTGAYADVIGGEFFMTANSVDVDLTQPDLPYTWSSDVGFLTFVPEPSGMLSLTMVLVGLLLRPRR